MRIVSFIHQGRQGFGIVQDSDVIDCTGRVAGAGTVRELLAQNLIAQLREQLVDAGAPRVALSEVDLLPPVPEPQKIICVGVNYPGRNQEVSTPIPPPRFPNLFYRSPHSFVGHKCALVRPAASEQLDYECEFAMVIGKGGRHIAPERAMDHVFGLTLCNEGTVSDWCKHGTFNVTQGKNFDASGSMGPWIVTTDELDLDIDLQLSSTVNDEVRQQDRSSRMIFSFRYLVSYISSFATLTAGDVIVTGTPLGNGKSFSPPRWLKPDDRIEIVCPQIGTLSNTVVDEKSVDGATRYASRTDE